MTLSTWARVRCACGGWREINSHDGHAFEWCARCGYRQALRGRPPADEHIKGMPRKDDPRLSLCVADGCTKKAASLRTDMCAEHCDIRRKEKRRIIDRERMRATRALAS